MEEKEQDIETQQVNSLTTTTTTTRYTTTTTRPATTTTTTTSNTFTSSSKPSPVQIFQDAIYGGNAKTTNTTDVINSNKDPSLVKDEEAFKAYSLLVNWISKYTSSNVPEVLTNKTIEIENKNTTKQNENKKKEEKGYQSFMKMFQQVSIKRPIIPLLTLPKS